MEFTVSASAIAAVRAAILQAMAGTAIRFEVRDTMADQLAAYIGQILAHTHWVSSPDGWLAEPPPRTDDT